MGNCLVVHQDKRDMIKFMTVLDGSKVLKTMPPSSSPCLKVQQDEGLVDPLMTMGGLSTGGVVLPQPKAAADPSVSSVRVKLVISKQELKRMLEKEGMSLDDMVSAMRREAAVVDDGTEGEHECCGGWRPSLESIPEGASGF